MDDKKLEALLREFEEHRKEIKKMIAEIEDIRSKIKDLIPENLEYRYKMLFEERVKTIVAFFNTILDMRKEITKSVKDELELRRKIKTEEDEVNLEDLLNISEFATKIDDLKRKRDKLIQSTEITKDPLIDELNIEIPGLETKETEDGEKEGRTN
jgi:hypothetical protein